MGALYDVLERLSPVHDPEVLDGYRRYELLLADILTPEQIDAYAAYTQKTGEVRIFEEMSSAELAELPAEIAVIAAAITSDNNISMENRRVVALLNQHGEHSITPDF